MSGYYNLPGIPESAFLTFSDWIGYVKDDGTYGWILQNGVMVGSDWSTLPGKPSTFPPTIGTTSTTAKAGNYSPTWSEINSVIPPTATFPAILGTSSTTAKVGNWYPSWSEITDKPSSFPVTEVQWTDIINKPNSMDGYNILDGITGVLLDYYLQDFYARPVMDSLLDEKANNPATVAPLGTPTLVPTVDIQTLYDKVNELLIAIKQVP